MTTTNERGHSAAGPRTGTIPLAGSPQPVQARPDTRVSVPAVIPPATPAKLKVHPDAPGTGIAGLQFRLNRLFGRQDETHEGYVRMPKPNRKERARREAEEARREFWNELHLCIAQLRALINTTGLYPRILTANYKGTAGKTTLGLYVGSLIAYLGNKPVILLPTTLNTATSTAGEMAGLSPVNAFTVSRLAREYPDIQSFLDLASRVQITPAGLMVVYEDPNSVVADNAKPTQERFEAMSRAISDKAMTIIYDAGNDDIGSDSVVLGAARQSTVIDFSCLHDSSISAEKMISTMDALRTDTSAPEPLMVGQHSLPNISTPEKVARSIVVAHRVRPDEQVDFDTLTRSADQSATTPVSHRFVGQGMTVQYDHYIGGKDGKVCDIHAISLSTFLSYVKICVANYRETARLLGIDISHVDEVGVPRKKYHPQLQAVNDFGDFTDAVQ